MTDSERIKMLEETVILMCKCLDVQRFLRLSENQQERLGTNIMRFSWDLHEDTEGEDK